MRVVTLEDRDAERYEAFLKTVPYALYFHSDRYRRLLRRYLDDRDRYLLAVDGGGRIRGALPAFLRARGNDAVLNSLPFYGSNGGILTSRPDDEVATRLLEAFQGLAAEANCVSSTVISTPGDTHHAVQAYRARLPAALEDERIGQLTRLDDLAGEEALLARFDSSARRNVRKARKLGVTVETDFSESGFHFLCGTHQENIRAVGGLPKEARFFDCVRQLHRPGEDADLFVAHFEGEPVAALLVFYFQGVIEYFTPAIHTRFRDTQALPLIVFEAMRRGLERGFRTWNWGGTWKTQSGVYRFKRKWGATEAPYRYHTVLRDESILDLEPSRILERFPHYFVVPFDHLKSSRDRRK